MTAPITITYGTVIKDNDARHQGRTATIRGFQTSIVGVRFATYQAGRRTAKIRLDRIFTDGKARLTGWNVVL